jgi:FixJ family two-component response regulator
MGPWSNYPPLRELLQSSIVPYVAVVDDEEPVRKALKRLLRASGLEAEGYASGKDFLEASAQREPDCVVIDLHMPAMSGLQVLRALQAARRSIPIVIITAHDAPETREQCIAAGAAAYLRKPLDEHVLLGTISAAVTAAAHERNDHP